MLALAIGFIADAPMELAPLAGQTSAGQTVSRSRLRPGTGAGQGRGTTVSVAIAEGRHPVPSRTRKLSPPAPMVLPWRRGGRVGRRRDSSRESRLRAAFGVSRARSPGSPRGPRPGARVRLVHASSFRPPPRPKRPPAAASPGAAAPGRGRRRPSDLPTGTGPGCHLVPGARRGPAVPGGSATGGQGGRASEGRRPPIERGARGSGARPLRGGELPGGPPGDAGLPADLRPAGPEPHHRGQLPGAGEPGEGGAAGRGGPAVPDPAGGQGRGGHRGRVGAGRSGTARRGPRPAPPDGASPRRRAPAGSPGVVRDRGRPGQGGTAGGGRHRVPPNRTPRSHGLRRGGTPRRAGLRDASDLVQGRRVCRPFRRQAPLGDPSRSALLVQYLTRPAAFMRVPDRTSWRSRASSLAPASSNSADVRAARISVIRSRSSVSSIAVRTIPAHFLIRSAATTHSSSTSRTGPKWLNIMADSARALIRSMLSTASSTSMSGGGVAGRRTRTSGKWIPRASHVNSAPLSESTRLTWWKAWPGVYITSRYRSPSGMRSPSFTERIRPSAIGSIGPNISSNRSSPP